MTDNEPDIVTRLRGHIAITTRMHYPKDGNLPKLVHCHGPSPICQEAADEIERLRVERNNLRLEINRMVDKLTAQRDAARREACRWMAEAEGGTPVKHSTEMGWFCFGEKP